jgi:hypothetical protein
MRNYGLTTDPTGYINDTTVYAKNATADLVQPPQPDEFNMGVEPLDSLPAKWFNFFNAFFTKAVHALHLDIEDIYTEMKSVLADAGISPSDTAHAQVLDSIKAILDTRLQEIGTSPVDFTKASSYTPIASGNTLATICGIVAMYPDILAPKNHANTGTGYGIATSTYYGHVKVQAGDGLSNDNGKIYHPNAEGYKHVPNSNTGYEDDVLTIKNGTAAWADGTEQFAQKNHASVDGTYGLGTATEYGHLKVTTGNGMTLSSGTISHTTGAGYNHIPSGGSSGQVLTWNSDGVAVWGALPSGNAPPVNHASTATTYGLGTATEYGHLKVTTGNGMTLSSGTISHTTGAGYNHIPSGGSSGQYLGWSSSGTATWTTVITNSKKVSGTIFIGTTAAGDTASTVDYCIGDGYSDLPSIFNQIFNAYNLKEYISLSVSAYAVSSTVIYIYTSLIATVNFNNAQLTSSSNMSAFFRLESGSSSLIFEGSTLNIYNACIVRNSTSSDSTTTFTLITSSGNSLVSLFSCNILLYFSSMVWSTSKDYPKSLAGSNADGNIAIISSAISILNTGGGTSAQYLFLAIMYEYSFGYDIDNDMVYNSKLSINSCRIYITVLNNFVLNVNALYIYKQLYYKSTYQSLYASVVSVKDCFISAYAQAGVVFGAVSLNSSFSNSSYLTSNWDGTTVSGSVSVTTSSSAKPPPTCFTK